LAQVLRAVLDRNDRRTTGLQLAEHVRREYDWSVIAARTEAVYRGVVKPHFDPAV
jgi:glycosyltransferase involved in cell wall biosynthesis